MEFCFIPPFFSSASAATLPANIYILCPKIGRGLQVYDLVFFMMEIFISGEYGV